MSRIDYLIAEHCPDGVEHKALGDLGEFTRGSGLQKKDLVDEGLPAIHYGQIFTTYGTSTDSTISYVSEEAAIGLRYAKPGDLVIATTSENDEDVCKAVAWLGDTVAAVSSDALIYSHSLDPRYIAYFFQSADFQKQKIRHITGTKVRRVSGAALSKLRIPVPPLTIQREIASILDKMERLEVELEAELEARVRQYDFYRENLLSFSTTADVDATALTQLLREPLTNGRSVRDGTGYPVLRLTALHGPVVDVAEAKLGAWGVEEGERFKIQEGDLLLARGNGSKGLIARASLVTADHDVAFPDTMIRVRPDPHRVLPRYLFYAWESRASRKQIERIAKMTSGVWKVNQKDLGKIILPVPPLHQQEQICRALDKMSGLVTDLSEGLPAEITARRQQYEYYRDRLLTFKEKVA